MQTAIVIGGSLAGMCAARALEAHFEEVLVIERDVLPRGPSHRAGTPQSHHVHALLSRGRSELERMFPGFERAMMRGGAQSLDAGLAFAVRRGLGWQTIGANGDELLWASRALLEDTVRTLLSERGRVKFLEATTVVGLARDQGRVRGVKVRDASRGMHTREASLVVDASGRNSRVDTWLRELGVTPPERDQVDVGGAYASRIYRAKPTSEQWWKGLWVEWEPPSLPRAGVLFPIEGDRWFVTVAGILDDRPPTDEAGFDAFLQRLSSPVIARAVAEAEPLSEIFGSRSFANTFRRYERWQHALPGFIAVGDSVCAFNPIYGQGMSVAAACAGILERALKQRDTKSFERRFFRAQAAFMRTPWMLATSADRAWPHLAQQAATNPWIARYLRTALPQLHRRPLLRRMVGPVFSLTGSPLRLFAPHFAVLALGSALLMHIEQRLRGIAPIPDEPPGPKAQTARSRVRERAVRGAQPLAQRP